MVPLAFRAWDDFVANEAIVAWNETEPFHGFVHNNDDVVDFLGEHHTRCRRVDGNGEIDCGH